MSDDHSPETRCPTTRRALLRTGAAVATSAAVGTATTTGLGTASAASSADRRPDSRPVRRSIRSLRRHDPDDVLPTFRDGLRGMRDLPESDPRNFRNVVEIHGNERGFNNCEHGNWEFLPWHRAYLHYFEEIVRGLTGNEAFAVPYWDWLEHEALPGEFRGDAGDPLSDSTRTLRSTADREVVDPGAVARHLEDPNFLRAVGGWAGPDPATDVPTSHGSGGFEQPAHDYVHVRVGGHMAGGASPTDASFWAHHSQMDRLWWEWNARGNPNPADPAFLETSFGGQFVDRDGEVVADLTIADTLAMPAEAYTYDRRLEVDAQRAGDRGASAGKGGGSAGKGGGPADHAGTAAADAPGAGGAGDDPTSGVVDPAVDAAQTATADVELRELARFHAASDCSLRDGAARTVATDATVGDLLPFLAGEGPAQLRLAARSIDMPVGESLLAAASLSTGGDASTSPGDHLGTYLFFGAPPAYPDQDYVLDVGDELRACYRRGEVAADERVAVHLAPRPLAGRSETDASVNVGELALEATQSVIDGEVVERGY